VGLLLPEPGASQVGAEKRRPTC